MAKYYEHPTQIGQSIQRVLRFTIRYTDKLRVGTVSCTFIRRQLLLFAVLKRGLVLAISNRHSCTERLPIMTLKG